MIHIDQAVVGLITAAPEVAMVVSHRIYASQHPQGGSLPAIVYAREINTRAGFVSLDNSAPYARATYTITALAETYLECRNLARAIRRALEYSKTSDIRLVRVTEETDTIEAPPAGDQMPVHRTDLTIEVTHIEP
jgi:hypothetical protein